MKHIVSSTPIHPSIQRLNSPAAHRFGARWRHSFRLVTGTLACALFAGLALSAQASDPIGIYAFVDKVVLEPNDTAPERIQVWGGFALAKGRGDTYDTAQRGYMYFKLPPGKEDIARKEWSDFKSVEGTSQLIAFGSRHDPKGTVRKPDAKPENPDPHPKGWGLTKVKARDYAPLKELVALQTQKPTSKSAPKTSAKTSTAK